MSVTGKKSRQQSPEKQTEYTLVYRNKSPNKVKAKINQKESVKKPKTETQAFIMDHLNMFDSEDDTQ